MRIGIQLFATARKAITIESSDFDTTGECVTEIESATRRLQIDKVKKDLLERFGAD